MNERRIIKLLKPVLSKKTSRSKSSYSLEFNVLLGQARLHVGMSKMVLLITTTSIVTEFIGTEINRY